MKSWFQTVRHNRLALLGGAAALLLATAIVWNLVVPHTDAFAEAIRKRGYPVTLAELDAWYPAVPPAENAALVYTNAFAHLTNSSSTFTNFSARAWLPPLGQSFSAQEKADLVSLLDANREALQLLRSASASGRSRYPLDFRQGYLMRLSHLLHTKPSVSLLAAEALLRAGDGQTEAATQSFLAAARVAESLAEEPVLISQCVRSLDWKILLPRLQGALSLAAFTDGQLAALQQQVEIAERPRAVLRAWVGEWVCAVNAFQDRRMIDGAFQGSAYLFPKSGGFRVADLPPWARAGCLNLLRAAGLQRKDEAFTADYLGRRVAAMELPYPARFAATERLRSITNVPSRAYVFSQLLLSVTPRFDPGDAEHVARVRVAATVLAIERFRLAHGNALPDSLAQLSPGCLRAALLDPFDGKPLHYRKHGASYVVYSVGSDLQDNDGADLTTNYLTTPQDIGMVVRHGAQSVSKPEP